MGNKNTRISFEFTRWIYFTNENVNGCLHLNIDNDTEYSNINSVSVILRGVLEHTTHNAVPVDIYTSAKYILESSQSDGTKLTFRRGQYSWPFSISIIENLPPSCQTPAEHMYYYVEAIFECPWYKHNMTNSQQVRICPHVNLQNFPKDSLSFGNDNQRMTDVMIRGQLQKCAFIVGEQMKFKLEIFNTKRLLIKNVMISIYFTNAVSFPSRPFLFTRSKNLFTTVFEQCVPNMIDTREEMISQSFEMTIPKDYIPPTFNCIRRIPGRCHGATYVLPYNLEFAVIYTLQISVNVEGLLRSASVKQPIYIGTIAQTAGKDPCLEITTHPNPTDDTNICDDRE